MESDGHNFLSFWTVFLPFYPHNNPKDQNFEKMKKKVWRYHQFTIVYQKSRSYYAILFPRYGA